ncbi:MAG: redoxin family protein [Patescibacteria group bacterium]
MSTSKPYILIVILCLIVGTIYFINKNSVIRTGSNGSVTISPRTISQQSGMNKEEKSKRYELAKEITTPDGFINTDKISISEFIGKKVVLIDFWTYSCINCQRTTPYLNAWYEKYKDNGFVIIGVHTPEFEFEKDYNNVKTATEKFGIKFPVVLDNDYSTWTAYKNRYWPRKYLIDIDGYIVYDHIGEGGYEETEQKIQEALAERMTVLGESGTINQLVTKEVPVQGGPKSPETYFGSARSNQQKNLLLPKDSWNITPEFAQNNSANANIVYKYTAKDVFFVAEANTETIVEVLLDGKPLGGEAGADIVKTSDGKTIVKIKEARLYKIIQGNQSETHFLKFIIQEPGLKAFTFTFG